MNGYKEENIIVPGTITTAQYESLSFWNDILVPENLELSFAEILPKTKNWCDEIKQWGNEDSTCIQLIYEKNKLVEFIIRLDLRDISNVLLQSLLYIISNCNYVILINELKLIKPNLEDLLAEIALSEAYKYFPKISE